MKHPQLQPSSDETPTLEQQDRLQRAWHRLHVVTLRGGEDHTAYVDDYEAAKAEVLAAALAGHEQTVKFLQGEAAQRQTEIELLKIELAVHEQERRWQPIETAEVGSVSVTQQEHASATHRSAAQESSTDNVSPMIHEGVNHEEG